MTNQHLFYVGNPHTVAFDLQTKSVKVRLQSTDQELDELWSEHFSQFSEILLCLSGGMDSQFSAHLACKYCKNVSAITFQYIWHNDVVNASDVLMATRFCERYGISHRVVDIDLKDFLDNHLKHTAKNYYTLSPQIACHLYAMEKNLANSKVPVLMGGEVPLITHRNKTAVMPFRWPSSLSGNFADDKASHFQKLVMPYEIMSTLNQINLIRDPFLMSDKIHYLSLARNLLMFETKKIIVSMDDPMKTEITEYKRSFYESFGFDFMVPLKKFTGFERLKVHLAMQTGRYNEFDILYRQPLRSLGIPNDKSLAKPIFTDESQFLLEQAQNIIDHSDLRDVNSYDFDW